MLANMELKNPVSIEREKEIAALSKSVNPIRLKNNPIELDFETICGLYDIIVKKNNEIGFVSSAR